MFRKSAPRLRHHASDPERSKPLSTTESSNMVDNLTVKDTIPLREALEKEVSREELALFDDNHLLRFLVARRGDVALAKGMVIDYIAFRKEWQVDSRPVDFLDGRPVLFPIRGYSPLVKDANIDMNHPEVKQWAKWLPHHGGGCWHKFDKEGRPLVIELPGYHDAKGFVKDCPPEEAMEWHVRNTEVLIGPLMEFASKKHGGNDGQLTVIMDTQGLGMHQMHLPGLQLLKTLTDCDQKYYPERLHRLFVVNAPYVFTLIYRILRGWLDKRVQDKVFILGSDYQTTLLKYVDADNLPAKYGGKCSCRMEGGCVPRLDTKGHGRLMEDEEEELELVEGEPDFDYKATSVHGQYHFNLEILEGMLVGKGVVSVAFVTEEPVSAEVQEAGSKTVVQSAKSEGKGKTARFSFPVSGKPASYNIVWTRADGQSPAGEFELEFGFKITEDTK